MTPPQSHTAPAEGRGHGLPGRDRGNLSPDSVKSNTHEKLLITNEASRLVYEPGVTGHKSEVMMSPASRIAWRGSSLFCTRQREIPLHVRPWHTQ